MATADNADTMVTLEYLEANPIVGLEITPDQRTLAAMGFLYSLPTNEWVGQGVSVMVEMLPVLGLDEALKQAGWKSPVERAAHDAIAQKLWDERWAAPPKVT